MEGESENLTLLTEHDRHSELKPQRKRRKRREAIDRNAEVLGEPVADGLVIEVDKKVETNHPGEPGWLEFTLREWLFEASLISSDRFETNHPGKPGASATGILFAPNQAL